VFVGKNGAGKTTVMKLMLGLIYPTEGIINILGEEGTTLVTKLNVGFLPEKLEFSDFITVNDFFLSLSYIRKIDRTYFNLKFEEYLKYFEMGEHRKKSISSLSKGMKQKVGIIQTIIHNPDILLLDEPTSGLDPIAKKQLFDLIKKFKQEEKTVIISTHKHDEIENITDKIVFFNEGKILSQIDYKTIKNTASCTIFEIKNSFNLEKTSNILTTNL
jgi:ABC-2 type transport system ATP-binding protein